MKILKAPEGRFPQLGVREWNLDKEEEATVLTIASEVIGRGYKTAIDGYLNTHEKRLNMLKMNGFTIEGDVELKVTVTNVPPPNDGMWAARKEQNPREKAFAEVWDRANLPITGVDHGNGILQDLFIGQDKPQGPRKWHHEITSKERMIVATVIQWLGSNVGMEFLEKALKKCGYKIVKTDE